MGNKRGPDEGESRNSRDFKRILEGKEQALRRPLIGLKAQQIHAALLALDTGRPVKFVYSRKETALARYHRHPSPIWVRHHADRTGQLLKVEARILLEGRRYMPPSMAGICNACSFIQRH